MRVHLTTPAVGTVFVEKRKKELLWGNATGHHQSFVAVVAVEPVLRSQKRIQGCRGFVACSGNVKDSLPSTRVFLFDQIDLARHHHGPVKGFEDIQRC